MGINYFCPIYSLWKEGLKFSSSLIQKIFAFRNFKVATHSSILAWEIPWAEKPGGLQSLGSPRVGPN